MNTVILVLFVLAIVAVSVYGIKKKNLARTAIITGSQLIDFIASCSEKKDDLK
jgi:hypothetical protein